MRTAESMEGRRTGLFSGMLVFFVVLERSARRRAATR